MSVGQDHVDWERRGDAYLLIPDALLIRLVRKLVVADQAADFVTARAPRQTEEDPGERLWGWYARD